MTLQIPEAKCQLHVAMRNWPVVDDSTALFLLRLHWRIRQAVILTHGQELTQEQIAARLRVSVRTVSEDLQRAYDAYEEAFRGEFN
jgi:DNA-directed RNA polymerase specialized sigma24 family protein